MKKAFTLAEVLITIGVLGVVAALTLPTVVARINHTVLKNQFKTAVSIINQNIMQAKINSGIDKFGEHCTYYNGAYVNSFECLVYLHNVMVNKGTKPAQNYKTIDRSQENLLTYNGKTLSPSDMASWGVTLINTVDMPNGMYLNYYINSGAIFIGVDINGAKRPNKFGHDIFLFFIDNTNDRLTGYKQYREFTDEEIEASGKTGYTKVLLGYPCSLTSNSTANGFGCSWYALADKCPYDDSKTYFECLP